MNIFEESKKVDELSKVYEYIKSLDKFKTYDYDYLTNLILGKANKKNITAFLIFKKLDDNEIIEFFEKMEGV